MKQLTKDDLIKFFNQHIKIGASQKSSLSVLIYGGSHSSECDKDKTELVEPDFVQIEDICSFRRSHPLFGSFKGGISFMKLWADIPISNTNKHMRKDWNKVSSKWHWIQIGIYFAFHTLWNKEITVFILFLWSVCALIILDKLTFNDQFSASYFFNAKLWYFQTTMYYAHSFAPNYVNQ